MTGRTLVVAALVLGLAAFTLVELGIRHGGTQVSEAEIRAEKAETRGAVLAQGAKAADRRAGTARRRSQALEANVRHRRAKLNAIPRPAPVPPPPDADQQEADLRAAGLSVLPALPADLTATWTWHAEALRVPLLEERLDASEALNTTQAEQTEALKLETQALGEARNQWRSAQAAQADRAEALQDQVRAMKVEMDARRRRTWLLAGGALLASYLAGRR